MKDTRSLPIFALICVDATVKPVHWELTGTWLWLALFAGMAGVGWWLVASTRQTVWEMK
ncbi:MAG: hypothetical protein Q7J20_02505 [Candidatus Nitrotoga sp.]|nr:hypothetical protein [Candidatus Nitrotoga sp.]MDO9446776.1 hypothetical protein [Candidatus Nitrotoga sp.]